MKKLRFLSITLIVTISCFSQLLSMELVPVKLTDIALEQRYETPKGISDSYYEVICTALDSVEKSRPNPVENVGDIEVTSGSLVASNSRLSSIISKYIPEEYKEHQFENCMKAIQENNLEEFKNSFEMLRILHARFSENVEASDWIHQKDKEAVIENCKLILTAAPNFFNQAGLSKYIGDTLLHRAACLNRSDIVQILIDNGADINIQNDHGITPLFYAVEQNALDVAQILLQAKADQTIKATKIWSYYAVRNASTHTTPLHIENRKFTVNDLSKKPQMQRLFDLAKSGEEIIIPKESEFHSFFCESLICCPCAVAIGAIALVLISFTLNDPSDCFKNSVYLQGVRRLDQKAWGKSQESGCCCLTATHKKCCDVDD